MSINIQIEKIHLVIILVLVFLGIGVFVINALTPGVKPNPGHLISETAPPSPCTANQVLKFDGSNWFCGNDDVGGHGDGTNCPIGQYAKGVDASGNAQGCIADVDTDTYRTLGIAIYEITSPGCGGGNVLTTTSICTKLCCYDNGGPTCFTWKGCSTGACNEGAGTCPNTHVGYLVSS